jgi:polysaccharide deacetylase family protein (PEP-CTERM system associated)
MAKNILTVDLEDWFVVENLRENISFEEWEGLQSRIITNTEKLLELFDYHGVLATFFVLGWIARRSPRLVSLVASFGHEIACHSYRHNRVDRMSREEFREDTGMAIAAIKDACGITPIGYRAPSWSIGSETPWAYETLADMGFIYDSSMYPIKHDFYGEPGGPKRIFRMQLSGDRVLYEIPASTVSIMGKDFPVGGGGYLRHSPLWFTERMIKKLNQESRPAVVYLHPWEIDEKQPRLNGLGLFRKFRQYGSISTLFKKINHLLMEFDFGPACDYIRQLRKKPIGFER